MMNRLSHFILIMCAVCGVIALICIANPIKERYVSFSHYDSYRIEDDYLSWQVITEDGWYTTEMYNQKTQENNTPYRILEKGDYTYVVCNNCILSRLSYRWIMICQPFSNDWYFPLKAYVIPTIDRNITNVYRISRSHLDADWHEEFGYTEILSE